MYMKRMSQVSMDSNSKTLRKNCVGGTSLDAVVAISQEAMLDVPLRSVEKLVTSLAYTN